MTSNFMMSGREMRAHVTKIVQSTLKKYEISPGEPYTNVLAKLGYPKVVFRDLPPRQFGLRNSHNIVLNSKVTCSERLEFTAFHELLHCLIEEDGQIDSNLLEHVEYDSKDYRWRIEELCDIGAAEFLMPSIQFRELMEEHDWRIAGLVSVTGSFRCSLIAAAFHFAHLNPDPCSVVVCELARKNAALGGGSLDLDTHNDVDFVLTIAYSARNEGGYPMLRSVPVPGDHVIYDAWKYRTSANGRSRGFFNNPVGTMDCEAIFIKDRVYAAFYRSQRRWVNMKNQPTLDLFI